MPSSALKRISIRWLPEPAYEDTDTIALNVGGYFVDLRVKQADSTIEWSRAGERIALRDNPRTFQWTHIIDSLNLTVPDEAYFEKLPNGDDLEIGTTPCPFKGGIPIDYEEVWRDVTSRTADELSWILQSSDGTTFVGKVGGFYLAIRKERDGGFSARREDRNSNGDWSVSFSAGEVERLPPASALIALLEQGGRELAEGGKVAVSKD